MRLQHVLLAASKGRRRRSRHSGGHYSFSMNHWRPPNLGNQYNRSENLSFCTPVRLSRPSTVYCQRHGILAMKHPSWEYISSIDRLHLLRHDPTIITNTPLCRHSCNNYLRIRDFSTLLVYQNSSPPYLSRSRLPPAVASQQTPRRHFHSHRLMASTLLSRWTCSGRAMNLSLQWILKLPAISGGAC